MTKKRLYWVKNTSKDGKCPLCGTQLHCCSFAGYCPKCAYVDGFANLTEKQALRFKDKLLIS